jgi:predicted nucleic-acid-binding protein
MVVLIDTNIIIDFLAVRKPFYDSAFQVMEKCASGEAEGYIAFHSLPNLWYIFRKIPEETRRLWLEKICKILKVASASQESVLKAIKMDNFTDFEDCLQDRCAEEVSANYIITRNTADFETSVVSAIEPDEWLKKLK